MKSMKKIKRIAAGLAALSVLSILGCAPKGSGVVGRAAAAGGSIIRSYPWSGGTLTWTGDVTGTKTFKTVFCYVVTGSLTGLHAPGLPMTQYPTQQNPAMAEFPHSPGITYVDVEPGAGGSLEFQAGQFHDPPQVVPPGVSPVKDGGRYGIAFHEVGIPVYGAGGGKEIKLNGTLWCNRVVAM